MLVVACSVTIDKSNLLINNSHLFEDENYLVVTQNIPVDNHSTSANVIRGRFANEKSRIKTK